MTSIITQDNPHFIHGTYATIELKGLGVYNIVLDRYVNGGGLCVRLELANDPTEYFNLSTNVLDTKFPESTILGPREFAVKNYSENTKVVRLSDGCPYFKDTGKTVRLPSNIISIWSLV